MLYNDLVWDTQSGHALSPDTQVLIALRFYATDSLLQVVGDMFGVNQGTVYPVVRDVSLALNRRQATAHQMAYKRGRSKIVFLLIKKIIDNKYFD